MISAKCHFNGVGQGLFYSASIGDKYGRVFNFVYDCGTFYDKDKKILNENKDLLKLIAETLLEEETITKEQIDYLVKNGHMPDEEEKKIEDMTLEELRKLAKEKEIKNYSKLSKEELIKELEK